MAVIKSGDSTDQLKVDAASKAARVTLYDSAVVEIDRSLPIPITVNPITVVDNDLIGSFDVSSYKFISLQLSGNWVGTVRFQGSNDNGTFFDVVVQNTGEVLEPYVVSTDVNGGFKIPILFKYLRVRVTAFTSGIVEGTAFGHKEDANTGQISSVGSVVLGDETTKAIGTVRTADGEGNLLSTINPGIGHNGLVVIPAGQIYHFSTENSTTTQLGPGDTFIGGIDEIINQQSFSILSFSDQEGILTIEQFTDSLGLKLNQTLTFTTLAGIGFSRGGVLNGNYVRVSFQNTSSSTTVQLQVDTAYGTIPSSTQMNNSPTALMEINGTLISTGGGVRNEGTQRVSIATDDLVPISLATLPSGSNAIGSVEVSNFPAASPLSSATSSIAIGAGAAPLIPLFIIGKAGAVNVNSVSIRNVPAILRTVVFTNYTATARHFKLYDTDQVPVAGNGVPVIVCSLPAGGTLVYPLPLEGFAFSNGIGATMTLKPDNNDVTPTATEPDFSVSIITT